MRKRNCIKWFFKEVWDDFTKDSGFVAAPAFGLIAFIIIATIRICMELAGYKF